MLMYALTHPRARESGSSAEAPRAAWNTPAHLLRVPGIQHHARHVAGVALQHARQLARGRGVQVDAPPAGCDQKRRRALAPHPLAAGEVLHVGFHVGSS